MIVDPAIELGRALAVFERAGQHCGGVDDGAHPLDPGERARLGEVGLDLVGGSVRFDVVPYRGERNPLGGQTATNSGADQTARPGDQNVLASHV